MLNAQYYDYPEGQDCFGKMVAINKYAVGIGFAWSTVDTIMITKPKGYLPILARYVVVTGPLVGMASAFTLGTYMSTNLRGKDDRLNYIVGGFCAGGVYGAVHRSFVAGCVMGMIFAVAGAVKKLSKIEGWEFFPKYKTHAYGSLRGAHHDWTILKEPPRNWTTGKE